MVKAARKVVVVCDSSKFDRRSLSQIMPLGAIHYLITDRSLPREAVDALLAHNIDVTLVSPSRKARSFTLRRSRVARARRVRQRSEWGELKARYMIADRAKVLKEQHASIVSRLRERDQAKAKAAYAGAHPLHSLVQVRE